MSHYVFVYGTLKTGQHNHGIIADQRLISDGSVRGSLYVKDLPYYKSDGDDVIAGELYQVDDECLARLDRLEGYKEHNPELSHYNRIKTEVSTWDYADGEFFQLFYDAYIYEYNREVEEKYRNHIGDYRG